MDQIKKKMQAMKIEKDNAMDRADAAEEKARQAQERVERVRLCTYNTNYYNDGTHDKLQANDHTRQTEMIVFSQLEANPKSPSSI